MDVVPANKKEWAIDPFKGVIKKGFLSSKPYRSIRLTKKGKNTANNARQKHKIVYDFLIALGLDKKQQSSIVKE